MNIFKKLLMAQSKATAGYEEFSSSGTFVVPYGYTQVTICMIGGGGSGASGNEEVSAHRGGGHAGSVVSQAVSVTYGIDVTVTIGSGGARVRTDLGNESNGLPGNSSYFGAVEASGGAGGIKTNPYSYAGNGGGGSNCYGSFNDGTRVEADAGYAYGGQRGLANGGNGGQPSDEGNADDGTKGSGGGGARNQQIWARYSGAGGTGFLKVSWS